MIGGNSVEVAAELGTNTADKGTIEVCIEVEGRREQGRGAVMRERKKGRSEGEEKPHSEDLDDAAAE